MMSTNTPPFDLAGPLLAVAQLAGARILAVRQTALNTQTKADRSPVTDADLQSEEVIIQALEKLMPGVGIIAEEMMSAGNAPPVGHAYFLVDPLDGTKSFVAGSHEFTVNIAFVENRRPIFGLIYAPATGACYLTVGRGTAVEIHAPAGDPPAGADFANARFLLGESARSRSEIIALRSDSHVTPSDEEFLGSLKPARTIKMSSSLKFCLLARGDADVYPRFGDTHEWDTAAGQAVLEAAGGAVLTPQGAPVAYGKQAAKFVNGPFIAWRRPAPSFVP